jgi:hypothetical protein
MSQCPNCGLQRGLHHSILPGCLCTTASPFTYAVQTSKREWVGLTDEEIQSIFIANSVIVDNGNAYMVGGLRAENIALAIEAKLKEKNT